MTAPFDPADWLWRFIGARGSVTPAPDCRVIAGWKLDDEAEWTAAKTIWAEIDPYLERRAALRQLVRGVAPY